MTKNDTKQTGNLSPNDIQIGGDHYKKRVASAGLQHWDIVALFNLDYFIGNATKYQFRWEDKGGIQDLEKSVHYIQKKIDIERARAAGTLTLDILRKAVADLEAMERKYNKRFEDPVTDTHASAPFISEAELLAHVRSTVAGSGESISTSQHLSKTAVPKCSLCDQPHPNHTDTCSRRTKRASYWCTECKTIDGHKDDCSANAKRATFTTASSSVDPIELDAAGRRFMPYEAPVLNQTACTAHPSSVPVPDADGDSA